MGGDGEGRHEAGRVAGLVLCAGSGYGGGALAQAGRLDLAVCAWLAGLLVAAAWVAEGARRV